MFKKFLGVWEGGKYGGRRDCIEGKREVGWVGGKKKNNGMNQTSLLYINL